jgi:hypothetical protein
MNSKPQDDAADHVMKIPPVESPRHEEALLDQAVAESFPASDPISPAMPSRPEPGDVARDEEFTNRPLRQSARMGRNAPLLAMIGAAAFALLAIRALRRNRSRE